MPPVTAFAFIAAMDTSILLVTLPATQAFSSTPFTCWGNDFIPHRTELSVPVITALRVGTTIFHFDVVPPLSGGSCIDAERSRTSRMSAFLGVGLNVKRPQARLVPPAPPFPVPPFEPAAPLAPVVPA